MPKRKKLKPFWKRINSLSLTTRILFIIGFFLIIIPIYFYTNETIQLAFFTPNVPVIPQRFAAPVEIIVPAVNIDLPIKEELISHGAWSIADNAISHLYTSARPGENGPIILYGHNTNDRFGPIRWLSTGQKITLKTTDGKTHSYIIFKTEEVSPSQINLLNHVNKETLILYTCDGFADLQRFLVFASPSN